MDWYIYPAIVTVGIIAGFINTLAGSGSLLTLPLLMFLGLPAGMANGTNRVAIFLQNVVAVTSFRKQKVFEFREGIWLALPATAGSFIGALIAVNFNEQILRIFIGALLLFMFFLILLKPDRWIKAQAGTIDGSPKVWRVIIFFLIIVFATLWYIGSKYFDLGRYLPGSNSTLIFFLTTLNIIILLV